MIAVKRGTIRETVLRIMYSCDEDQRKEYSIVIVDRSVASGVREISFSKILRVDSRYIYIKGLTEIISIPIHRVIEIRYRGRTIWTR